LACAYGLVITGLLVVGVGISQSLDSETDRASVPALGNPWLAHAAAPAALLPANPAPAPTLLGLAPPLVGQNGPGSSVDPIIGHNPPTFLFDPNGIRAEPASYILSKP
jgi:hypothetical protein